MGERVHGSVNLLPSNRGCNFGGKIINHFSYADDMSLLSSSAKGLQMLLDILLKLCPGARHTI